MEAKDTSSNLGVAEKNGKIYLFQTRSEKKRDFFDVTVSTNGSTFRPSRLKPVIIGTRRQKEKVKKCRDFRIARIGKEFFLNYRYGLGASSKIFGALSFDLLEWKKVGKLTTVTDVGAIVPAYLWNGAYVMYYGGRNLRVAVSEDLAKWKTLRGATLTPRKNHFDHFFGTVGGAFVDQDGIVVIYTSRDKEKRFSLGAAVFDKNQPQKLLWRSERFLWQAPQEWKGRAVSLVGIIEFRKKIIAYVSSEEKMATVILTRSWRDLGSHLPSPPTILKLNRSEKNPILQPRGHNSWESQATFNPAAVYEGGKVHLVYRAIGDHGISVLGYAASADGIHFDERLDYPIYVPTQPFEGATLDPATFRAYPFMSGGGYGGCEDPRITKVGDRFYMTYVAFDGRNPPRVALTSIAVDDFLNKRWNWDKPILISSPDVIDKNACILGEKVNGQFVVFHRIFPNILVDFVETLAFKEGEYLKNEFMISPSARGWDSRKLGAGAPPIKTEYGWLLIYQAVGDQDASRYKIGAMLLDADDPSKVLYRSTQPVLEPLAHYENNGHKWGVVYPCGAVVKEGRLLVYYGGADRVVCVAEAPLEEFMRRLMSAESPELRPVVTV